MSIAANISLNLLAQAVDQSHDGVTVADAKKQGFPLIYVNRGFERLTGYTPDDILGNSYRILQGADTEQPGLDIVRAAVSRGEGCLVTLRNYRKDGSMFWNELSISPVHDTDGNLTHYIGVQKDVTARAHPARAAPAPVQSRTARRATAEMNSPWSRWPRISRTCGATRRSFASRCARSISRTATRHTAS